MKPLLEVRHLFLSFHVHGQIVPALQDISLTLYEGEKLGIVGESGCGKSVLVKSFVRLLPDHTAHLEGEIWYKGQNLTLFSEAELQKIRGKEIGMIFQDPMTSLNPTLTIGTQIAEGTSHPSEVVALLHQVGIPDPERRMQEYPHTLSGGLRQRVMIAIALGPKPALLIADEPTTALDVTIQAQILELLSTLQKGKTTLLITHDLSVAASFCDRIVVMQEGKIIEDAPVEELFASPKHPYTKHLIEVVQ